MTTSTKPICDGVSVQLTDMDGNGVVIIGRVARAMKKAGVPQKIFDEFMAEAQSGDYDNLLQVCMKYVDVS